jgi:PAS domain S-box-containing protein
MTVGNDRNVYLATLPSSSNDRKAAIWAVGGSLLLFAAAAPFARISFPPIPAFIASYQSSLAIVYVITSVLLYSQSGILRSKGLLYLANGYLFTSIAIAGYALTYDDLFSDDGLFLPGPETTTWFYLVWHAAFPVFVLLYAMPDNDRRIAGSRRASRRRIVWSISAVCLAALSLFVILTVGHPLLPQLIIGAHFSRTMIGAISLIFMTCLISIALLLKKRLHSVLDVWMIVILCAWIFDISLSSVLNAARFDFGYYAGRIYGLFAAVSILAILLAETASLQLRLSLLMRQQAREAAGALQLYAERERLFSAAARSSNDAIITKSFSGTITGWNNAAERLFGYTAGEAVGESINIIVPDDRQNEVRDILDRVREGITIKNHETVRKTKDGRLLDISLSVSPVLSASGEAVGVAKVARDITDLKLNEEKFKLAVDASPSGLVMIDETGHIMLVNSETERLFDYSRNELLGRSIDILVPTEMRASHASLRTAYGAHPSARRMAAGVELFGQRRDGAQFPVEIGLNPIPTRRGAFVLAVIVDITERKNAERALRESEQMAQRILDTALDGFLQFDSGYRIVAMNRQAERILGWSRKEAIGVSVLEILATDYSESPSWKALLSYLEHDDHGTPGTRFELSVLTKEKNEIPLELSLTKYVNEAGAIFNAFIRDLTEQRTAEAQFRQSQKMEAIGQLTGGVAHDFNNILTVITGTIEILAQGVADRPRLQAITQLIDSAATRGAELVKHLLAFSRQQPLRPKNVDVSALVLETAKLLRPTLGKQLDIDLDIAVDTWSALVDPNQLTASLLNLALNARDATPVGGKITIRTDNVHLASNINVFDKDISPGDYVLIEVNDTGAGMDPATLSKVFEPFFTTKEVGKGTGLGLSMVYGFAKQSNGHVKIFSIPNVGTTVTLYLPRSTSLSSAQDDASDQLPIQGGKETVLVIEDDALVRTYVVTQIEGLGYRTLSATDANEAQLIIDSAEPINLLFTDIVLPGPRNGRQIANEAVRKRPGLKVLFTSGYTHGAFDNDAALDNDILILNKPYRIGELSEMIRQALAA